jgi:hypothetical protein
MATITATLGTVSDSTLVTVFNLAPQLIAVTPVNPSITVGQTQHFSETAYFSNGTTQDVTASAHWSSSSANISTINSGQGGGGLARGRRSGTATITETLESRGARR